MRKERVKLTTTKEFNQQETEEDIVLNISLRPTRLLEFIGQKEIVNNLKISITAAKQRKEPLEHILLSGPPGLGKCINKDSIVFTEKGMIPLSRLGDLSIHGFQRNKIKIYSLDGPQLTSHFYNNSESSVTKIKTHQGYELEGTPNHPIAILNDGKMEFVPLEKVKIGNYVAIQRGQNYFGDLTDIPKYNFIKGRGNTYNYDKYRVPTELTPDLARICGYLIGDGYVGRTGEMCFHNNDPQILTDFQNCWLEIFGQKPKISYPKNRCPVVRIKNLKIREFLIHIGMPYAKARTKSVPFSIMCAPKEIVKEFLKGLFECDGHIRPNCRQIDISSASEWLIKKVQIILLNFGIISRTYKDLHKKKDVAYYRLYITGEDVEIFKREIGFISEKKSSAQDAFFAKFNTNKDLIPYGKDKLKEIKKILVEINNFLDKKSYRRTAKQEASSKEINECLNKLENRFKEVLIKTGYVRLISNPKIFWDRIILKENGFSHTADVTVPSNHAFFANGFINHNTSLAHIIAHEMGTKITATSGPAIERAGDLIGILTNLEKGDILFIDEIHRLPKVVEEFLYPAMESFQIDFVIDKGPYAKTIKFNLKPFTLVGATTRVGLLTAPLRGRFGIFYHLDFYLEEELAKIIKNSAKVLGMIIDEGACSEIARRSRGTPRVANRLLRRIRDYAQVSKKDLIDLELANKALDNLGIDKAGFDEIDRKVLKTILDTYGGGPVGVESLAATLNEEVDTIIDTIEPYLLKAGYLKRTARGRLATKQAYDHFGIKYKKEEQVQLF